MRNPRISLLLTVLLAVLLAGLAAPMGAEKLYHWVDADGTVSFTDEYERIPKAERESAKVISTAGLDGYARFTPEDQSLRESEAELRRERIARLRHINQEARTASLPAVSAAPPGAAPGGSGGGYTATVDVNGSTIRIPADMGEGDGPVVVEQIRAIRKGKNVTQTATVVRRGDEVLMIVFPEPHRQISSSDFIDEEDLLDD